MEVPRSHARPLSRFGYVLLAGAMAALGLFALVSLPRPAPLTASTPTPAHQLQLPLVFQPPILGGIAGQHGIRVGTAVYASIIDEATVPEYAAYAKTIREDFNSITPETAMQFRYIHPCPPLEMITEGLSSRYDGDVKNWYNGDTPEAASCRRRNEPPLGTPPPPHVPHAEWDWDNAGNAENPKAEVDEMVLWAQRYGIGFYGHSLVWWWKDQMPEWLKYVDPAPTGSETIGDLEWLMERHITGIIQRYCQDEFRGTIYAYDVVNEAVDSATGGLVTGGLRPAEAVPINRWWNPWYGIGDTDLDDDVNPTQTLTGNSYVRRAFGYARQAVQTHCSGHPIELILNDHGYEQGPILPFVPGVTPTPPPGPTPTAANYRPAALLALAQALQTPLANDPHASLYPLLDGVGVQSHLTELPECSTLALADRRGCDRGWKPWATSPTWG